MFKVPNWLHRIFDEERFSCPSCGLKFDAKGVVSVGIKNVDHQKNGNSTKLWVEYICAECSIKVGYEICSMDLQKLSDYILAEDISSGTEDFTSEQQKSGKIKKVQKKKSAKSKITQTEIKQMKKFLEESQTFEEFLNMIGETSSDLSGKFKIGPEDVN